MENRVTLDRLLPGQRATVQELCLKDGLIKRLMNMGVSEGAQVECVGVSPAGDPRAYLIRGAVLALRGEDCRGIWIT